MLNESLRDELLAMRNADLQLRSRLVAKGTLFGAYNEEMASLHRQHNVRLREVLLQHGWPGRTLAGEDGCDAAWLVLQHAVLDPPLMRKARALLERAVQEGDAPGSHLGYLVDRIRTLEGLPQVYGTQHDWDESGHISPLPIEDAGDVDQRRAALGLEKLEFQTARLRQRSIAEGDRMPADLSAHRNSGEDWARALGWRV
jgi:hypothetical protein